VYVPAVGNVAVLEPDEKLAMLVGEPAVENVIL
jgi:hypothetical protein